ncbi:MAG TPA: hypothetical protein VJA21_17245, partial [Verrucomicrobiae bacterium]
ITARCSEPRVRVVGLRSGDRAWLWLFDREAAWGKIVLDKREPGAISNARIELAGCTDGSRAVEWWDTREGKVVRQENVGATDGVLRMAAPEFSRDIACVVKVTKR